MELGNGVRMGLGLRVPVGAGVTETVELRVGDKVGVVAEVWGRAGVCVEVAVINGGEVVDVEVSAGEEANADACEEVGAFVFVG